DADPFEGERAYCGGMGGSRLSFALIERARPEGARDALANPFDKGLSYELGSPEAPMDPVLVSASFRDRGDADAALDGGGVRETLALLTECGQEPCREDRPRARQRAEESVVGELVAEPSDLAVEPFDGRGHGAQLRE